MHFEQQNSIKKGFTLNPKCNQPLGHAPCWFGSFGISFSIFFGMLRLQMQGRETVQFSPPQSPEQKEKSQFNVGLRIGKGFF